MPPAGYGGSPAPIDRQILEYLRDRLATTDQVDEATISDADDHFHPPPDASTPGEDADWPVDYRQMLRLVLDEIEGRITELWS